MAGEDPDVRRKHHRSPDDGVEEGSKRRKHSHRRSSHRHHHHRHRSSKHKHENKHEEEEEGDDLGLPPPTPVPVVSSPNSRPEDDKEEGEIFEEEENGVVVAANVDLKKKKNKGDSDAESGEIMSEDVAVAKSDNRNPGTNGDGSSISGKPPKETDRNLDLLPEDGETTQDFEHNIECSDRTTKILDLTDIANDSKNDRLVAGGIQNGVGKIDESKAGCKSSKSRKKKGDKRYGDSSSRDSSPSRATEDIGEKSYLVDMKTSRGSKPVKKGSEKDKNSRDIDETVLCRRGRSRSPIDKGDVDSRKHRKIDDSTNKTDGLVDDDEYTSVRHMSRKHLESMDNGRNSLGNRRTSMSPGSRRNKYKSVSRSPSYNRYNDEPQIRNRSVSRDHVRERSVSRDHVRERSVSRSTLQEGRVHHHERDVKSYSDTNDRGKTSDSREKAKDEYDHERVGRHGSKDHRSERERSSSYSRPSGREDRHGSRDTRDREKEIGREREHRRERERDRERVRDRNRDKDNGRDRDTDRDRDRDRDRDSYRGRDRNRREMERSRDGYKDFRHSKHDEPDYHFEKVRAKGSAKVSSNRNGDSEVSGEKLKRDVDEQDDYEERVELKLAQQEEEDIDRIKEESRKRRQAILEKYKQQPSQQQVEPHSECPKKEVKGSVTTDIFTEQSALPKVSVHTVSEDLESKNDGTHVIADSLFSVGKSPSQNGTSAFERIPGTGGLGDGTPKSERSADMFCDDIFGDSPGGIRKMEKGDGLQVERSGLNDNWDDAEGYYSYRFGEILDGRYEVTAAHGKGVFSTVVRAKDLKAGKDDPEEVAIKIIRNNDTMYKAGLEELVILKKLVGADPEDRRHCVRFLSSFKYRNHLCLVFESLHMNLREVLKKFGRNIGLKLTAVRAYAKQLFIALKHLRNCGVLHCDIKPDNMLVNDAKNVLKLCDFGNAMFAGKNEITPYLVSRFYRAPEIILGLSYDHPMDIWSVGCCLYELYSGKVLFPGPSNNDMLRLHMELKGPFPKKMLRKGAFSDQHFDQDLSFHATEEDPVTKKTVKRLLLNIKPKDIGTIITSSPGEDPKMLTNFKDLLERIFTLDPDKRMTVSQALSHPFITGK